MSAKKLKNIQTFEKSIDYFNFCNADNDLPILKTLSERFTRLFRVSVSNHLRMITNIEHTDERMKFGDWVDQNKQANCMFIVKLPKYASPVLIKFDRTMSYGMIDVLTGGSGKGSLVDLDKELTQLELTLLQDIGQLAIKDINEAWKPIQDLKAEYVRTEVNAMFIGSIPPESKMVKVNFEIAFNGIVGNMEILYPYSTLFPFRNELFHHEK